MRFDGVHGIDDNVVNHPLREVRDLLSSHSLSFSAHVAERPFTGQCGRPRYISLDSSSEFCTIRRRPTAISRGVQEELLPSAIFQLWEGCINRPVWYSNGWTGSSMKWRLMRAN